jgi:hypothetical protein
MNSEAKKPESTTDEAAPVEPVVILPGTRVNVFDPRLFVDDVTTPPSHTMQPATVLRRYGKKVISHSNVAYDDHGGSYGEPDVWTYPDLVDVVFDHDGRESNGHFTRGVEAI